MFSHRLSLFNKLGELVVLTIDRHAVTKKGYLRLWPIGLDKSQDMRDRGRSRYLPTE